MNVRDLLETLLGEQWELALENIDPEEIFCLDAQVLTCTTEQVRNGTIALECRTMIAALNCNATLVITNVPANIEALRSDHD